ncbi:CaiB/BaiF CoA transferase family protein [Conexibacter woesei]|uniref:L-carnitine dehydratase/bile acid-inducible protein F n=1 Tax=Conexibacter woesei (strain DSM 14684 / CCUG 47730 / CIP 108061 / JCM 11494 / NBRC 100937 / ID131577) TaxID=469383 RepID=D3FD91_CONWI|nr:CoA transferase [Conexibacter woesei]ADB53483.1 L-carnitine dehydratase/bile acid-inducible protein F [Conexibacter woesei DSM 14684]
MSAAAPLADVRVLAVEQFGAGPWATSQLADLGADVIKLEDPASGGDVGRTVPPFAEGEESLFFETFNRGKRSISLDLRTRAGRAAFERLVPHVDAIYCNLRGDQPDRLGLTYDALAPLNPRIVCCSLSGFGRTGPRAAEGAYDHVLQGLAGWMSVTGEPDAPPTRTGLSLVDFAGGYMSALALMAGVWRARRDGVGGDCDTSLHETALALLTYLATWTASAEYMPQRRPESAHPSIVPFQAFRTADGWITVACAKQKFWVALCEALDLADLLADPRFADFAGRDTHRDALLELLRPHFAAETSARLLERLAAARVPSGPVNDVAAALRDPQVLAREDVVSYDHPRFGAVRQIASPLRISGHRPDYRRAPGRGEHTATVLEALAGLTPAEIAQLGAEGAFGAEA